MSNRFDLERTKRRMKEATAARKAAEERARRADPVVQAAEAWRMAEVLGLIGCECGCFGESTPIETTEEAMQGT